MIGIRNCFGILNMRNWCHNNDFLLFFYSSFFHFPSYFNVGCTLCICIYIYIQNSNPSIHSHTWPAFCRVIWYTCTCTRPIIMYKNRIWLRFSFSLIFFFPFEHIYIIMYKLYFLFILNYVKSHENEAIKLFENVYMQPESWIAFESMVCILNVSATPYVVNWWSEFFEIIFQPLWRRFQWIANKRNETGKKKRKRKMNAEII